MPVTLATEVLGLEELKRNFGELSRRAENQVMRKGMQAGGNAVRKRMRQYAPRRRGKLAGGIQVKTTISRGEARADIAPRKKEFYGTIHDIGSRYVSARRWMRRALIDSQDEILSAFREAVASELSKF